MKTRHVQPVRYCTLLLHLNHPHDDDGYGTIILPAAKPHRHFQLYHTETIVLASMLSTMLWCTASKMQFFTFISSCFLVLRTTHSFSPASTLHPASRSSLHQSVVSSPLPLRYQTNVVVFASPKEQAETAVESVEQEVISPTDTAVATKVDPAFAAAASAPYPLDLPSPLLLSASMVLAIASTGMSFSSYYVPILVCSHHLICSTCLVYLPEPDCKL